jgi:hypothetical protein
MLKHENMKPPTIMPAKMATKELPDNQKQAPIIPPIPMLASNQKIHIANVFTSGRVIRFELASFYVLRMTRWQQSGISIMASGNKSPDRRPGDAGDAEADRAYGPVNRSEARTVVPTYLALSVDLRA